MGSRITLGVTGGVAAYKAAELTRLLQKQGHDVRVVMTRAAAEFVGAQTFAALTGHTVYGSLWGDAANVADGPIEHIAVAQATDVLVVAPATAHTLAKFALGLADDFLSTVYLATTAPVVVAPAMNVNMYRHAATQANLTTLRGRGVRVVEPGSGYLACGMTGDGRLAELEAIVAEVEGALHPRRDLDEETLLITAGGTREPLDPVRFLGNRSSGRMGYALAEAALGRGARVILVSAPAALEAPVGAEVIRVTEAAEMLEAVLRELPRATMVIAAAAVADFRAEEVSADKIRREGSVTLTLRPTEDIVRRAVEARGGGTRVIAFAAETTLDVGSARAKLERKGADAIVLNDISRPGLGFDSERNAATWLTGAGGVDLGEGTKLEIAHRILDHAMTLAVATR